uniref:tetratricopeptide repeat protein n=1 Tax=Flavobacterium sp. TaxID=239 RepID=UPI00404A3BD9
MKKILPFILLFLCYTNLIAQENIMDSLTSLINNSDLQIEKAKLLIKRSKAYPSIEIEKPKKDALDALQLAKNSNDTELQIEILNQLSGIFSRDDNYAEALKLDEQALTLSISTNNHVGKIRSYKNMGRNLKTMGKTKEAILKTSLAKQIAITKNIYQELPTINNALGILYRVDGQFNESLSVLDEGLKQVDKNKSLEALLYMNKGNTLSELMRLDDAATSYFNGLKIAESLQDTKNISQFYNNLATLFKKAKQYEKAIDYNKKALALTQKKGNKVGIGIAYDNLATIYDLAGKQDSVIGYRKKAIVLFEEIKDEVNLARSYHNLGHYYLLKNNLKAAKPNLELALKKRKQMGNPLDIASTETSLGILADKENRFDDAEKLLLVAQKRLKKEPLEKVKFLNIALGDHYKLKGDFEKALEQKEAALALQDSLLNESEIIAVINQENQYEKQKSKKELEHANAFKSKYNNNRIIFSIALLIVFVIALYSFIRWKKEDQKKKILLQEKEQIEIENKMAQANIEAIKKQTAVEYIELKNKSKIYLKELLFIRSEDHYLELVFLTKTETIRSSLKSIQEQLPPNFVRCHKSYVVNLNFVKQNNAKEYILTNLTIIPKSRTFQNK